MIKFNLKKIIAALMTGLPCFCLGLQQAVGKQAEDESGSDSSAKKRRAD